ncbi:GNAT family N-acetyltransferase [Emcibacter nanhaiensis]|uniref:GNAT family N-acetyltransferase n=1 Tax=Emcibacter nanhaiensis TaxID=1505037 RepID=A0A501PRG6_9PROT|nr:GNAT family N-acetyltransferase [Emcibacter nanhaiensis]TPD63043.1 GNAT family N-acetyltransferase [Emcibacter nanhaiensis]
MQTLETERLLLRPFRPEDIDFLDRLHGDMEVMRYTLGRLRSHEENVAWLKLVLGLHERDGTGPYLIVRKEDDAPLGRCGFSHFYGYEKDGVDYFYWEKVYNGPEDERKKAKLEIGYSFVPEAWGHGYATEAARAIVDFGFRERNYAYLCALIIAANTASINVAERLGFTRRGDLYVHNQPALEYGCSRKEWLNRNN